MEDILKQIEEKRNKYNENNRKWYHDRKANGTNKQIKIQKINRSQDLNPSQKNHKSQKQEAESQNKLQRKKF